MEQKPTTATTSQISDARARDIIRRGRAGQFDKTPGGEHPQHAVLSPDKPDTLAAVETFQLGKGSAARVSSCQSLMRQLDPDTVELTVLEWPLSRSAGRDFDAATVRLDRAQATAMVDGLTRWLKGN